MKHSGETIVPLAKLKHKGQVTIPADIREELGLDEGTYLEVKRQGSHIVMTPQEIIDRDDRTDAVLKEAVADARAGRVSPKFKTMKAFEAWLKTSEGRKFGRA
jgi:AbrB family looped-hinge helix DNA binding protein